MISQNGNGYSNVTRLRWLEGNLYTGLLNGGIITTLSPTTYQISSGSGIIVNLKNVCCNVTDLWFDNKDVRGNIEVLSTPSGNIVRELIKNGIRLGVSSRGMGSVRPLGENTVEVQDDFNLICFDIVSNPSTQGAFINEQKQIITPYSRIDSLIYDFLTEVK